MRDLSLYSIFSIPALALLLAGCAEAPSTVTMVASAEDTIDPKPPMAKDTAKETVSVTPSSVNGSASLTPVSTSQGTNQNMAEMIPDHQVRGVRPVDLTQNKVEGGETRETAQLSDIELKKMNFAEFQTFLGTNPDQTIKYTLVDAWGTFCGPCKENFPHVVEMHNNYGDKGLRVVSLSFDDPEDDRALKDAQAFLKKMNAVNLNILLNEESGVAYEKFDVNAIPAVFLFGPDGKEIRRFTLDDPSNQFTYEEVEKTVKDLLEHGGK